MQQKSNSGPTSDTEPRFRAIRHRSRVRPAILAVVAMLLLVGANEAAEGRIVRRQVVVSENTSVSPTDAGSSETISVMAASTNCFPPTIQNMSNPRSASMPEMRPSPGEVGAVAAGRTFGSFLAIGFV